MSAPMVEVRGVHKLYGTHEVLQGVDLTVEAGKLGELFRVTLEDENGRFTRR